MATSLSVIHSSWDHHFPGLQLKSDEFYQTIQDSIKAQQLPGVSINRISLSQSGILSAKREYLRVSRNGLIFDICFAPFGTSSFASWWLGETRGIIKGLIARIPFIGPFVVNISERKTYYQIDSENMFKQCIHSIIMDAIDAVSAKQSIRGLTELERLPRDMDNAKK